MSDRTDSPIRVQVARDADVSRAVMVLGRLADQVGFAPSARCMVATAVSELARNIVKYAHHGCVIGRVLRDGSRVGIEIVSDDSGPGIDDIERALQDHVSTGGTLGLGLPGVKRMMDHFELTSRPGVGTRVLIRKWK